MDPGIISTTVEATWTALQPYLPVLATKAVEKVGSELPAAVGKLWSGLRAKFDTRPPAKEALVDMLKNPDDSDLQAAFRVQLNKENEKAGIRVTMLAFLVKACVAALKKHPEFAASLESI